MGRYKNERITGTVFSITGRDERREILREGLLAMCVKCGISSLVEMMIGDAEALSGPKGKRNPDRKANRWGSTLAPVVLGGRKVQIKRPRIRGVEGEELSLPSYEAAADEDLLAETIMEGILCGLATRTYGRALEPIGETYKSRGTSKSAVSRRLIAGTQQQLKKLMSRSLEGFDIVALVLDGITVAEHVVIVAMGIDRGGEKRVLGIREGSTENATVATALLNDLIGRGLDLSKECLAVIDGGKGIRKALIDVMGEKALIQRCRIHKERNILGHLPEEQCPWVRRMYAKAWDQETEAQAKASMLALAKALERDHPSAAASAREGLDELFTVKRLALKGKLAKTLSSTNMIENLMGRTRTLTGKVKRWRGGSMIERWIATALLEAEQGFQRIHGYKEIPFLTGKLNRKEGLLPEAMLA